MVRKQLLGVSVALLLPACLGQPGELSLELGGGEWQFEPLADDAPVDLIYGAQGGWHVWVSMQATGFRTERVSMILETEVMDGSLEPEISDVDIHLEPMGHGEYRFFGWPAVLADPACVVNKRTMIRLTLVDIDGRTVTDERVVVPQPGRHPPPECTGS